MLKQLPVPESAIALYLDYTDVTDAGLKEVAQFKQLISLDLSSTKVTDAGLKELAQWKQLASLYLFDTKVTDAGLTELAQLQQLTSLELGRTNATTVEQLRTVVDKAIASIDQSLAIITALLRLAEIENSRRSASFGSVPLHEMLREVCDLYEPIAENKNVDLRTEVKHSLNVLGDRDLLFEAVANLVDNAIKFTPEGGRVGIELERGDSKTIVRVTDTGPGISEPEREAVLRRFYRSDKIRNAPGVGLGLSLVAAIVKLHGFRLAIHAGPGGRMEIICPDHQSG